MSVHDTIFALATPYGRSGVAVVRVSGPAARSVLHTLGGEREPAPNQAVYATFRDASGVIIDRGLALYFQGPKSFTGEDTVEFQLHGGLAIIRHMLSTLASMRGVRPAEAGEFTRRAFLNGKMDLLEAEGLADLINAESEAQKTQAMRQMQGVMSGYYHELRERIIRVLAHLEAYIDFPDEEIPESVLTGLGGEIREIIGLIEKTLGDGRKGERLREGFSIAILGAPNAGKSSLINALSGRDAAIVSQHAGTTRDVIEVHMELAGYPVIFMDTAGIRESNDEIEEEGVRRALARANAADIKLLIFDGSTLPQLDPATLELMDDQSMAVITKSDLTRQSSKDGLSLIASALSVCSITGEGVGELLAAVTSRLKNTITCESSSMITRARHRSQLEDARAALQRYNAESPLELACEELRQAAVAVGKITGKIQMDEVLDVIFRQFCIGK